MISDHKKADPELDDQHRSQDIGAEIVDAYIHQPQTDAELAGIEQATRALVDQEPW
jgi:hypothetical protein